MGRPYNDEVEELGATYADTLLTDITELSRTVREQRARPLILIGSGGSLTACHFAARLHETVGRLPARVLTPLEFLAAPSFQEAGVLLLSAGGNNQDILTAAAHAVAGEYASIATLCTRSNSALRRQLAPSRHASVFEFEGPSGKDGFLATNSLLLTCGLLMRAYGFEPPAELPAISRPTDAPPGISPTLVRDLLRPSTIALAHGWALPAATDLESKWSEVGFGSVTVTDIRNFAHGRHHGLARRMSETVVLGLATADEERLLAETLARLPPSASSALIRTSLAGPSGALDLIAAIVRLTNAVGRAQGVDPGRPHVPPFGRALYHARLPRNVSHREDDLDLEDLWIRRKVTHALWANASQALRERWRERCRDWIAAVQSMRVGAVVFDYDGTLCEADERFSCPGDSVGHALTALIELGMWIGIATGRGDSAIAALTSILPESVRHRVFVGIYNGAAVFRLSEAPPLNLSVIPEVHRAHRILSASPVITGVADIQARSTQLTVLARAALPAGLLHRFILEALASDPRPPAVKVLSSGHSVDVISSTASKERVVERVHEELSAGGDASLAVMTIGDQGQASGNDVTFLAQPLGLSVEQVSSVMDSCWNVAPRGTRRTSAMLRYLSALRPLRTGGFEFSVAIAAGVTAPAGLGEFADRSASQSVGRREPRPRSARVRT